MRPVLGQRGTHPVTTDTAAPLVYSADGRRAIRSNGRSFDCYFVTERGLVFAGLSCGLALAERWLAGEALD